MAQYDIIGDVHGEGTRLHQLLVSLGYRPDDHGCFRHETRTAVFVGDLVDRGPEQRLVLETVRAMVEAGSARIVMGNHELNAILWSIDDPDGSDNFLRKHSKKNRKQHRAFLDQLAKPERVEWRRWFRSLPLFLELEGLRVVHACWHDPSLAVVRAAIRHHEGQTNAFFLEAGRKGGTLYDAVETLTKGPEISLAAYGLPPFLDKGEFARSEARVRWWHPTGAKLSDLAIVGELTAAGTPYPDISAIPTREVDRSFHYSDTVPVVYGHYWRRWYPEEREDWTTYTACVDFSGSLEVTPLVAYRFEGETEIDPNHYLRWPISTT